MFEALLKIDFTISYRSMIMNLWITICNVNSESERTLLEGKNACKKIFLLALVLVHSTVVDIISNISLTILVMVPVEVGFCKGLDPILFISQP